MFRTAKIIAIILSVLGSGFFFAGSSTAQTTFVYDDLGRLVCAHYDNNKSIVYSYDTAGNRKTVTIQSGPCPT